MNVLGNPEVSRSRALGHHPHARPVLDHQPQRGRAGLAGDEPLPAAPPLEGVLPLGARTGAIHHNAVSDRRANSGRMSSPKLTGGASSAPLCTNMDRTASYSVTKPVAMAGA